MFNKVFSKTYPIIGVIHLDPLPGQIGFSSMDNLIKQTISSLARFQKGGVDGILIENASDKPHTMTISKAQVAAMSILVKEAVKKSDIPIGVTCLLLDWEANFAIAKTSRAKFTRLNVFVDTVMREVNTWGTISPDCRGIIRINPLEIKSYRETLNAKNILLLADIHVKYMSMLEPNKTIQESAKQAEIYGADAVIISGSRTGLPTNKEDIIKAQEGGNLPVLIGSGLIKQDVPTLLPYADGAIVGTAFEKKEGEIESSKVKSFMNEVYELRKKNKTHAEKKL
ncbi:MAG: BtpA/SgcQ family protein [bacterium]|nr:BtpA/SgcQ family protein [bacterium]